MSHSEETTAVLTANELTDGTKLIVKNRDGWKVIIRDDLNANAHYGGDADDQVWYEIGAGEDDPMSLHQHVKDADAVYALGEKLADFR